MAAKKTQKPKKITKPKKVIKPNAVAKTVTRDKGKHQESGDPVPQMTRRRFFFESVATASIGGVIGGVATYELTKCQEAFLQSSKKEIAKDRDEAVRCLFFPTDREFELLPARDHRTTLLGDGEITYPNELRAMEAIGSLFKRPATYNVKKQLYAADPQKSWVLLGSPVSNAPCRLVHGDPIEGTPSFDYASPGLIAELEYSIAVVGESFVHRITAGKRKFTRNYAVIDRNKKIIEPKRTKGGQLTTDVLLVGRVPKTQDGTEFMIFAGLHGPAIRAIDLLLHNIEVSELHSIQNDIGDSTSPYQALFQVEGLRERDGDTVPTSISYVKESARALTMRNTSMT